MKLIMRYLNLFRNIDNWWYYFLIKSGIVKKRNYSFLTKNGLSIKVPKQLLHTFKEVFFANDYLRGFPKYALKSNSFSTVIDIGANAGFFSLYIANKFPYANVFAFEPIPNNFQLIKEQIVNNPDARIQAFNMAIGENDESIVLNYNESDSYTTSASIFKNRHGNDEIIVNSTSIDNFAVEKKLDSVDFLKLDCEGSEYSIIYNMSTELIQNIKMICMETHSQNRKNENKNSLKKYLEKIGFNVNTYYKTNLIWAWR